MRSHPLKEVTVHGKQSYKAGGGLPRYLLPRSRISGSPRLHMQTQVATPQTERRVMKRHKRLVMDDDGIMKTQEVSEKELRKEVEASYPSRKILQGWPENAKIVLAVFAQTGIVKTALNAANIRGATLTGYRKRLKGFTQAWQRAKDSAADVLEQEAWNRAVEGDRQPIYYRGERVGSKRIKSDLLLMFLLKGTRPEKYNERGKTEHTGDILGLKELARLEKRMKRARTKAIIPAVKVKVLKEG